MSKILSLEWAAGFFEGEGSATIRRDLRHSKVYESLVLAVSQVHREPLDAFCDLVGAGKVRGPYGPYKENKQAYFAWEVSGRVAIHVAEMLIPLMFNKGEQVQQALDKYKEYLHV